MQETEAVKALCIYYMGAWPRVFGLWPCDRLLWLDWHGRDVGTDHLAGTGICQGMMGNKDIAECESPPRGRDRGGRESTKDCEEESFMLTQAHPSPTHVFCVSLRISLIFHLFKFIIVDFSPLAWWCRVLLWLITLRKMAFFVAAKSSTVGIACTALSYKNREKSGRQMGLKVK